MSRVLITGSNGFIGKHLTKRLLQSHFVIGVDRHENALGSCSTYVKWDIGHEPVPKALGKEKIDFIVHAAALISQDDLLDELIYANCLGSFRIVEASNKFGSKCIIYFSSLPVVGNKHTIPIHENAPLSPMTMYHATKAAGELIISQAANFGIKASILRIPSPVGPGMPEKSIVPSFVKRALNNENLVIQGEGSRVQNYLDVRDIAEVVSRIVSCGGVDGVFNVGSKNACSNRDLAQKCIEQLNSLSRIEYSNKPDPLDGVDWTTDDSKLKSVIGDYQKYSLEKSISDIAKAFNENSLF